MLTLSYKTRYFLYFFIVLFSIYQNCPLSYVIGEYGKYPVYIFCLVLSLFLITFTKYKTNKTINILFALGIYLIIISVVSCFIYLFFGNSDILLTENIFIKALFGIITYLSLISICFSIYNLTYGISAIKILRPFYITLIIMAIIAIIEYITLPYAFQFIPSANEYPYYRIRLLTTESSMTSLLIIIYIFFSFYYIKLYGNVINRLLFLCAALFLVLTTSSKSLYIYLLICIITLFSSNLKALFKKNIILTIFISIFTFIILLYFIDLVYMNIMHDIENYTSTVTRIYTIIIAIIISIVFPFGVGMSMYMAIFPKMLDSCISIFSNINIKFNLSEIYSFINATTSTNLTAKSGFAQYAIYWGLFGSVVFIYSYILLKPSKKYSGLASLWWVMLLAVTFAVDFRTEFWVAIGIFMFFKKQYSTNDYSKNNLRCDDERNNISRR